MSDSGLTIGLGVLLPNGMGGIVVSIDGGTVLVEIDDTKYRIKCSKQEILEINGFLASPEEEPITPTFNDLGHAGKQGLNRAS